MPMLQLSRAHGLSSGVSLTTESRPNVALYEHFRYRVRGWARVGDGLETWTLFWKKGRPSMPKRNSLTSSAIRGEPEQWEAPAS
jgi:hypothetical protein